MSLDKNGELPETALGDIEKLYLDLEEIVCNKPDISKCYQICIKLAARIRREMSVKETRKASIDLLLEAEINDETPKARDEGGIFQAKT